MKQFSFFKSSAFPKEFGGELLKGKRKSKRPLATDRALHLILRAENQVAVFLRHRKQAIETITKFAQKFSVRIYQRGFEMDHIHLVIKFKNIANYKAFARAVTGTLAKKLKLIWLHRPYTRVLEWGRDFRRACGYALQNELEAMGLMPYQWRSKKIYLKC